MNSPKLRFKDYSATWKEIILNDFFYFIDGDRGKKYPNENDFLSDGHCLFLNAHNISDSGLTFKNTNWLTKEKHESLGKGSAEYKDMILTTRGSKLGKIAVYDETIPYNVVRINSAMLLIRQKQAIDLKYTLYLFKDAILPKFISQHIVGSAQPHITVKDLKAYSTYIPVDVTEQKKIGYFFSLLNSKILKQQEKVELLKQQKTGLMQKIFTRNLRFKDENGQDYPEWDLRELRDIGQVITGNTPSKAINGYYGEEYSWASPADMKGQKYIEETETKLSVIGYQKTRKIPSHSIMMTCIGSTIGKIAMSKKEMSTNQQINTLVPENQNYNDFLYYVIQWEVPRIKSLISSQAVPIINKDTFMKIVIPVAPEEEAIKIGQILSALDHKIQKNIEKHSILVKQKKGFMQQMFI